MNRLVQPARFPARLLVSAREAFEAGVAIRYDAPWKRLTPDRTATDTPAP
jgi:hypothetical protein